MTHILLFRFHFVFRKNRAPARLFAMFEICPSPPPSLSHLVALPGTGSEPVHSRGISVEVRACVYPADTLRLRLSNLLILFERVDKAAVELFIVRGTSENAVLRLVRRANNRSTGIIESSFLPFPSSWILSSSRIFLPRSSSSSSSHPFYILLQSRACTDNGILSLEDTRDRDSRLSARATVRLFENRKIRPREKSNGLVSTNYEIPDEAMSSSSAFVARTIIFVPTNMWET